MKILSLDDMDFLRSKFDRLDLKLDQVLSKVDPPVEKESIAPGIVTDERVGELIKYLHEKECPNKIDCIRYYRILYGCGLKEARDAVLNILKN